MMGQGLFLEHLRFPEAARPTACSALIRGRGFDCPLDECASDFDVQLALLRRLPWLVGNQSSEPTNYLKLIREKKCV